MTFPKPPQAASVAITTLAGAALGYALPLLSAGPPASGAQWRALAFGALTAGVSAVVHLYQQAPAPAVPVKP